MKQDDKSLKNERYAGRSRTENLTYIVALFFVFIGLINVTPQSLDGMNSGRV